MALIALNFPPTPVVESAARPLRCWRIQALGTACAVQYAADNDAAARAFEAAAERWVVRFEGRYTRFRRDSIVGRINATAGNGVWHEIDEETEGLLEICAMLHTLTKGVLDATAGPLARLWDYRAAVPRVPDAREIATAQRLVGWNKVERAPGRVRLPEPGMALDFGGWGKEFAVDAVARIAREHGIPAAMVDFGHDLFALGSPPGRPAWHVGLENPARPGTISGSIAVTGRGVASSGDYLRGFTLGGKRYGHIIDARTGWPVANGCRQVTVVASSCLQAGVYATTAFILGPVEGLRFMRDAMGVEARLITDDAVHETRGFFYHVVA